MVYGSVGHFGPGVEEVHPLDEVAHPEAQRLAGPVSILLQIEGETCHFCKSCLEVTRHISAREKHLGRRCHFPAENPVMSEKEYQGNHITLTGRACPGHGSLVPFNLYLSPLLPSLDIVFMGTLGFSQLDFPGCLVQVTSITYWAVLSFSPAELAQPPD